MASEELETVYFCPFCKGLVFFNHSQELIRHLLKEHNKDTFDKFAEGCKTTVKKDKGKWGFTI